MNMESLWRCWKFCSKCETREIGAQNQHQNQNIIASYITLGLHTKVEDIKNFAP